MRTARAYRGRGPPAWLPSGLWRQRPATHVVSTPPSGGAARRAHGARVTPWVGPHLERRRSGVAHPVEDFLFTYYSFSPGALRRWHPGFGASWPSPGDPPARRGTATSGRWSGRRRRITSCSSQAAGSLDEPTALTARGHRARARRTSAASACTSGRWSTGCHPTRCGTPRGRCGSASRHRRGGRGAPDRAARTSTRSASSPTRPGPLNVLHPGARRPAGVRAAGLPARRHGPLQARLQAQSRGAALTWWPTASSWPATSGSSTCARRRTTVTDLGYEPVRIETAEGKPEYAAAQRRFAERGAPLASGCWPSACDCSAFSRSRRREARAAPPSAYSTTDCGWSSLSRYRQKG